MVSKHSDVHVRTQLRASRSLLKFCEEHGYKNQWIENIHQCVKALEKGDIVAAVDNYNVVPLGGMGCFNDWWPPVIYENETEEYVWAVFEALVAQWSRLMSLSCPNPSFKRDALKRAP